MKPPRPARLLSRDIGYTNDRARAMRDEPEPVEDDVLASQRRSVDREEHRRFRALLDARRQLPLVDRLRLAQSEATVRGIAIAQHEHAISRRLDALEARVYRPVDRLTEV